MTKEEHDAVEQISYRLGHIAATAALISDACDFNGDVVDALAGIEAQLRDLSRGLDAAIAPYLATSLAGAGNG